MEDVIEESTMIMLKMGIMKLMIKTVILNIFVYYEGNTNLPMGG
jgi:hypothetical protein